MTQVRSCRHARPVLGREERNAAPEFVREPRRGLPRSSEPSSLVRPFGSREVLCISSALDEINFPALLRSIPPQQIAPAHRASFRISDQT